MDNKLYTEKDLAKARNSAYEEGFNEGCSTGYANCEAWETDRWDEYREKMQDQNYLHIGVLAENISDALGGAESEVHIQVKHKGFYLLFKFSDIPEDDPEFTDFFLEKFSFTSKYK